MSRKLAVLFAMLLPATSFAQPEVVDGPTLESAQAVVSISISQWGRASSERLDVHYRIESASMSGSCTTVIKYDGGKSIVLEWTKTASISFRDIGVGDYRYLVKMRRPPNGYVQLYFSADDVARRVLAAAEFMKGYCDPLKGEFT